mgnify:CR=1 FL=1
MENKKYEALRKELITYIKENKLKRNDHLPTVREIITNSGYSYSTVNRTLIEMEKEGIISKHQGKGLYVDRIPNLLSDKQFALIIPLDVNPHRIFIDIVAGVKEALEKENISLLVAISNMNHEEERDVIERLISKNTDGLILYLEDNYKKDFSHLVALKNKNIPFVLIDRFVPDFETDYVVVNNRGAMLKVCTYLKYKKECDKIIFVPSNDSSIAASSSDEKRIGYINAMRMLYGNDKDEIVPIDELLPRLNELSSSSKNLGISFNHDAMVTDMLKMLKDANTELPANVHVFGYNNSRQHAMFPTVEQFNKEVGIKAAEILIQKIKNPSIPLEQVYIEPKLILPDDDGGFYQEA